MPQVFARLVFGAAALAGMTLAAETWRPTSIRDDHLHAFAEKGDTLFGGSAKGGIRASTDGGWTWQGIPSCFGATFNSVIALHDGLPSQDASVDALWIGPTSVLAGVAPSHGVWILESTLRTHRPPGGASASPKARRFGHGVDALGRVSAWGP